MSPTTLPNTERADEIFSSFLGCFSGFVASSSSSLIFLTLFGFVGFSQSLCSAARSAVLTERVVVVVEAEEGVAEVLESAAEVWWGRC